MYGELRDFVSSGEERMEARTRTHARARAHTHTHTHTHKGSRPTKAVQWLYTVFSVLLNYWVCTFQSCGREHIQFLKHCVCFGRLMIEVILCITSAVNKVNYKCRHYTVKKQIICSLHLTKLPSAKCYQRPQTHSLSHATNCTQFSWSPVHDRHLFPSYVKCLAQINQLNWTDIACHCEGDKKLLLAHGREIFLLQRYTSQPARKKQYTGQVIQNRAFLIITYGLPEICSAHYLKLPQLYYSQLRCCCQLQNISHIGIEHVEQQIILISVQFYWR